MNAARRFVSFCTFELKRSAMFVCYLLVSKCGYGGGMSGLMFVFCCFNL